MGIVRQTAVDIVRHGLKGRVEWLPDPGRGSLLADPSCLVQPDGRRLLFAEHMHCRTGRGEIWSAELAAGQDLAEARFAPRLRKPFHLSYPQPFLASDGSTRLTAESWQAGAAFIWNMDDNFDHSDALFDGAPVIDPTLWLEKERVWLFCTFHDRGPNSHLYLFHAPQLGHKWTGHVANPVKVDFASARPAGPLFLADSVLVRPSQDCSSTYGGGVTLNAVTRLDPDHFVEEPIRRIAPVPGAYGGGLHTFCSAGEETLIDGKTWRHDPVIFAQRARRKALALLTTQRPLRASAQGGPC